jgi:hypothetical protein
LETRWAGQRMFLTANRCTLHLNMIELNMLGGTSALEHFPMTWIPVRRRKCEKIKELVACRAKIET